MCESGKKFQVETYKQTDILQKNKQLINNLTISRKNHIYNRKKL